MKTPGPHSSPGHSVLVASLLPSWLLWVATSRAVEPHTPLQGDGGWFLVNCHWCMPHSSRRQGGGPAAHRVRVSLPVSPAGRIAIDFMLADLRRLRDHDRDPVLNRIDGYPRDEDPGPVATDVMSFHADSAPVEADTWLCTYHGACSEGLRNDEALRKVDLPELRAALLAEFGGDDDADFAEYLSELHYDLHYAAAPGAQPFPFGIGHLWRIAVDWPGSPVPPCVHRAPDTLPGDPPRLLLIS